MLIKDPEMLFKIYQQAYYTGKGKRRDKTMAQAEADLNTLQYRIGMHDNQPVLIQMQENETPFVPLTAKPPTPQGLFTGLQDQVVTKDEYVHPSALSYEKAIETFSRINGGKIEVLKNPEHATEDEVNPVVEAISWIAQVLFNKESDK